MVTQGSGHVVNVTTSLVDHARTASASALASLTKGGLNGVTRSLATEYAARGVRVNAVALGVIKTRMHEPAENDGMAAFHPIGRAGEPPGRSTRAASATTFCLSPARLMTQLVSVDHKDDPRSGIVDALSTMVTDETL
jgi:NAD(P)-dependent dehydrogenase (short-subunit alcohol dehydrogenase family)